MPFIKDYEAIHSKMMREAFERLRQPQTSRWQRLRALVAHWLR